MIFRLPEPKDKDILMAYVQEHYDNNETNISASLELSSSDYSKWVEKIRMNVRVGDQVWGKSLLYLCFDKDALIGLLSIRYDLPPELSEKYGDIGYGVRPTKRRRGYATRILEYALAVCRDKGMHKVILGCYKSNVASAATIKKCGGILFSENDNYTKGKVSQYYIVEI